jgi:hypothetical protein
VGTSTVDDVARHADRIVAAGFCTLLQSVDSSASSPQYLP